MGRYVFLCQGIPLWQDGIFMWNHPQLTGVVASVAQISEDRLWYHKWRVYRQIHG